MPGESVTRLPGSTKVRLTAPTSIRQQRPVRSDGCARPGFDDRRGPVSFTRNQWRDAKGAEAKEAGFGSVAYEARFDAPPCRKTPGIKPASRRKARGRCRKSPDRTPRSCRPANFPPRVFSSARCVRTRWRESMPGMQIRTIRKARAQRRRSRAARSGGFPGNLLRGCPWGELLSGRAAVFKAGFRVAHAAGMQYSAARRIHPHGASF